MFKTKRQKRERLLKKWSLEKWRDEVEMVLYENEIYSDVVEDLHNSDWRLDRKDRFLNKADIDSVFATKLDRELGLPTDNEDKEYHAHWATRRNQIYVWFAVISLFISGIALFVSWLAYNKA